MIQSRRGAPALVALAMILVITASWWALALWPMTTATPEWLARTRFVCFGATLDGLPDAGGWVVLVGQPLGLLILLFVAWGSEVRAGVRFLLERVSGQITVGVTSAAILAGMAGVAARVGDAYAKPFIGNEAESLGSQLTRLSDVPPELALVNQTGQTITLDQYRGKAVLITFAFAHCQTVCPLVVHSALTARDRIAATAPERTPVVLVMTLDPLRDTPARLEAMANQWGMTGEAHVLSGEPDVVERTLNAWRIPRVRNEKTGDLSHPAVVYLVGPNGRIVYVVNGSAEQIIAAVRAL